MPLTEKKKQSNKRSQEKNNKRFGIIMKKQEGIKIETYLKNNGVTVNSFITKAIKEKIERETGKTFDEFMKTLDNVEHQEETK